MTAFQVMWGRFENAFELLNLRALKMLTLYKIHVIQCVLLEKVCNTTNFYVLYTMHAVTVG